VLLPVNVLVRRRDEAGVIGAALAAAAAAGRGHRAIARMLGRPADTVRGWLRRFAARAEQVRAVFTAVQVSVEVDPPPLEAAGCVVADAVVAMVAAARAVARRWPALMPALSPWEVACALTSGTLLAPAITLMRINTNSPLLITGY
jgi:hypothetical protein